MIAALVLVVLVSAAEAHSAETTALERAAEDALGAEAKVMVRSTATSPSAGELAGEAPEADLVASVDWLDAEHRSASLRCYIASEHRVVARQLSFDDQDRVAERGRLIGLSLAAMAPEASLESPIGAKYTPPVVAENPVRARETTERSRFPAAPASALGAIDLVGLGAVGLGGPATSLGAGLSGRWFFARTLSVRLGGGFRRGDVNEAHANAQFAYGALGLGFAFAQAKGGAFTFSGRGDLLLGSYEMRRGPVTVGPPEHQQRFLSGSDLLLESCWYLGENAGLVLGLGAELAFGDTDVVVAGQAVADVPPLRAVFELGARARF